jgi:hypothetical protein
MEAMADEDRRKKNIRLALILASIALVFFVGFVGKIILMAN